MIDEAGPAGEFERTDGCDNDGKPKPPDAGHSAAIPA
jgi:hypothetical protein